MGEVNKCSFSMNRRYSKETGCQFTGVAINSIGGSPPHFYKFCSLHYHVSEMVALLKLESVADNLGHDKRVQDKIEIFKCIGGLVEYLIDKEVIDMCGVVFPERVNLSELLKGREIDKVVSFDGAVFCKGFDAERMVFKEDVSFDFAVCYGKSNLSNCVFEKKASFRSTLFLGLAIFSEAGFNQETKFSLHDEGIDRLPDHLKKPFTEGERSRFPEISSGHFDKVKFNKGVHFRNRRFLLQANFTLAEFYGVPYFHGSELPHGTTFKYAVFKDTETEGADYAYRTLKLLMGKIGETRDETRFFALELRSERLRDYNNLKNNVSIKSLSLMWDVFISKIHDILTGYGETYLRPISLFIILQVIFFSCYYYMNEKDLIELTTKGFLKPLFMLSDGCEKSDYNTVTKSISVVQGLVSFAMYVLIGLAIRRRFKVSG